MKNKKLQIWLPLFVALVMIAGMYLGYRMSENIPAKRNFFAYEKRSPVQEVLNLIQNRYVDPVGTDTLGDNAIEEMLGHLDPHSMFIPSRNLQEVNEDLAGRFEGIGVEFNIFSDTIHVLNVLPEGPSDKAGLRSGDRLIKVGDSVIAGVNISTEKIKRLLRGPRGSQVTVTIMRAGEQKPVPITRGVIPIKSLDAAYVIAPNTGYIKLNKFSESTYEEFMAALEELQKKGIQKLILDLRDNGGGILEESVQIADEFLDGDKMIVYTEGKSMPKQEYKAKRPGLFEKGELVLLVDEGSASASEVLAGALQDWDRATIVGRRSFGKGLVQEQYNLSDGSALRLTVARYYTPLGRSIQKPYDHGSQEYYHEVIDRYHNGSLANADSNKHETGKAYKTKNGKTVYGGGGITPDVFVALDTTALNPAIGRLYDRNTIGNFVYRYYIDHLSTFQAFKSPEEFQNGFHPGDDLMNSLTQFALVDGIDLKVLSNREKQFLKDRVKTLMARQLWRSEGFYEVNNVNDPMVKKALTLITP